MAQPDTGDEKLTGAWAKTYAAKTKKDLLEAYSEWCTTYDDDSIHKFGYIAPRRAAEERARHLVNHQELGCNR